MRSTLTELGPLGRRAVVSGLGQLPLYRLAVAVRGFGHLLGTAERRAARLAERSELALSAHEQAQIARGVWLAARHGVVRANCLPQALVTCRLLTRRGVPARVEVGARLVSDGIEAHAWASVAGRPAFPEGADLASYGRFEPVPEVAGGLPCPSSSRSEPS